MYDIYLYDRKEYVITYLKYLKLIIKDNYCLSLHNLVTLYIKFCLFFSCEINENICEVLDGQ